VLVFGPYLVRSATIKGTQLALVGDLKSGTATELEVLAPAIVKSVSWNGKAVPVSKTATGTLKGSIGTKDLTPKLPNLKSLEWRCTDSLPEIAIGFDDSKWTTATKTKTLRPAEHQPLGGKSVLYADEYGYHQGDKPVSYQFNLFIQLKSRKLVIPRSIRQRCDRCETLGSGVRVLRRSEDASALKLTRLLVDLILASALS
jgi:hypothetical protein